MMTFIFLYLLEVQEYLLEFVMISRRLGYDEVLRYFEYFTQQHSKLQLKEHLSTYFLLLGLLDEGFGQMIHLLFSFRCMSSRGLSQIDYQSFHNEMSIVQLAQNLRKELKDILKLV